MIIFILCTTSFMHRYNIGFLPLGRVHACFYASFKRAKKSVNYRCMINIYHSYGDSFTSMSLVALGDPVSRRTSPLSIRRFFKVDGNCGVNVGIVLSVLTSLHCGTKCSLKVFVLASLLVANCPFSERGNIIETLFCSAIC